jgi:hypothetical protein
MLQRLANSKKHVARFGQAIPGQAKRAQTL